MKYFLCGNSGIINRGCEAIIDSTVKLLNCQKGNIYLATFAPQQDRSLVARTGINMISYNNYPSALYRYFCVGIRRVFKNSLLGIKSIQKPLFNLMSENDISLNIGGDTYCYRRPIHSLALNKYTNKNHIKNILWCCSVEKESINKEILNDLNRYTHIFAREQLTVENLISSGVKKEKIIKVCDPAFFLDTQETTLPENFIENNTVGINLSEMVINEQNPYVYNNILKTIQFILNKTNMNICLIPHVYNIEKETNDFGIIKRIFNELKSDRVSLIDRELNCRELKYIISKCRFFIGARTHSTIAAYSSQIPTLVLGYSVKSKGIAKDLFGTYKDYVLPFTNITEKNEILTSFKKLLKNENRIKNIYSSILPDYKKQLTDAIDKYLTSPENPYSVCDKEICCGCSACASICPKKAIQMLPNNEGFLFPIIDKNKCIKCDLCKKCCPVLNKPIDDFKQPNTYAGINKQENIRMVSSSGGIFTPLAERIIEQGGFVFAPAYDANLNLIHQKFTNKLQLAKTRGSKYIQSDIGDTYLEAKKHLNNNDLVLFSGTPCQIGGLYSFLGKEYKNLITQDVICRAVPSPAVWKEYIAYYSNKKDSYVKNVFFRDKTTGWNHCSMKIEFSNNKYDLLSNDKNLFMNGFINDLYTRNSCDLCSFRHIHRKSDITLGDFWGIENIDKTLNDNKGVTLILTHSKKGEKLLQDISDKIIIKRMDFQKSITHNPCYHSMSPHSYLRNYFFKNFKNLPLEKNINKYIGNNLISKIRRFIIKII